MVLRKRKVRKMTEVRERGLYHGICPPGYEKVKSYYKSDGKVVSEHCRKIKVSGRTHTTLSGLYNEGMIGQEDIRLGADSIIDKTGTGERNAEMIKKRATHIEDMMREQERKKDKIRNSVEND